MERRASQGTDEGPDSVSSAGSRASRKRAASIDVEEANNSSRAKEYSLETGPMGGEGSKDYICLCTPALKVPRPRNGEFDARFLWFLLRHPFARICRRSVADAF